MNVALDTHPLYTGRGGIARYVQGMQQGFRAVPEVRVRPLAWEVENLGYAQPGRALRTFYREIVWAKAVAPFRLGDAAVLHHTALPLVPFVNRARHVVTLHDLALLRHPERFRRWQRAAGRQRLRRVARADRILCVSRFTADEAMRALGIRAAQVEVVHHGGLLEGTAPAEATADWPDDFFLFVGSLEPGKNLALLREVYRSTREPLPPLLIAGGRWDGVEREGSPPAGWRFLGPVSDADLHALYRRARALVFPSRYEGFGLPLVEAMQSGCPVICGAVASLPEVGGDAVAYAELDATSFGDAMQRMLADATWRDERVQAGLSRGRAFSWEKCARQTAAAYAASLNG